MKNETTAPGKPFNSDNGALDLGEVCGGERVRGREIPTRPNVRGRAEGCDRAETIIHPKNRELLSFWGRRRLTTSVLVPNLTKDFALFPGESSRIKHDLTAAHYFIPIPAGYATAIRPACCS